MITGPTDVRQRYESLFFVGMAMVIVLLPPFPKAFGVALEASVLMVSGMAVLSLLLLGLLEHLIVQLASSSSFRGRVTAVKEPRFRAFNKAARGDSP